MRFKVKILHIVTTGPLIAILNKVDAKNLELIPLDRIRIKKGNKSEVVAIDVAYGKKEVAPREIGLFLDVAEDLNIKDGDEIQISIESKPESLDYIKKKLDKNSLTEKEIDTIIKDVIENRLTEIETTYFVSACYVNGMSMDESAFLAKAIVNNGGRLKFDKKIIIGKHCIGGVPNNRTTPIVVPIVAAAGLTIPKTSTRSITSASVTYDTPVIIKENEKIKIVEIGNFVDKIFTKNKNKLKHISDGEYIELKQQYKAPAFDNNYKIKEKNITGVFRHKSKDKEIIELTLETGRKVSLTKDHSIFTLQDGKISSVNAGDLNEGSLVVVPRKIGSETEIREINILNEFLNTLPDKTLDNIFIEGLDKEIFRKDLVSKNPRDHMRFYRNIISLKLLKGKNIKIPENAVIKITNSKVKLPIKIKINEELIKLLGYYAAEGHCREHRVEFYLGTHEKEFIKDLGHCIEKVFNIKAKIRWRKSKPSETDVIIGTKAASLLFRDILKLGNSSYEKRVPDIIFNINKKLKGEYFKAYIKGDGNKRSGEHVGYEGSTTSKELITGLQYIASYTNLAYSTSVFTDIIREFKDYTSYCAAAYHIYTQKENRIKPSTAYINQIPIKESGLKSLLNEDIKINHPNNDSKLKYKILNQDCISLEVLKRDIEHVQNSNNVKIKNIIKLMKSDLGFLKIRKIESVKYDKEYVYDLCIKGYENFIGGYGAICLHNSGTADCVEVFAPVSHSKQKIIEIVKKTNGCMVWGGTLDLASADDKLIKLEKPLSLDPEGFLLASILAKKASEDCNHVLIDIPIGIEAKIKTEERAKDLAKKFIILGDKLKIKVKVIITNGAEPIGKGIGPALEAIDVLQVLKNNGPEDLKKKSVFMAGMILEMAGIKNGKQKAIEILESGLAYKKFQEIIKAQGGNPNIKVENIKLGQYKYNFTANKAGKIKYISNKLICKIAKIAGAPQDKGAGIYINKKLNDKVIKNEILFTIYAESKDKLEFAKREKLNEAMKVN